MTKFTRVAVILCAALATSINYAYANEKLPRLTLTQSFINQSANTLTYTGVSDTNPETIFLVSPKIILPGSTFRVTSISNNYNVPDLSGSLYFQDTLGMTHTLHVTDASQMHYGQAAFVMRDNISIARLTHKAQDTPMLTYSAIMST